jgi:hypothetical protein
MTAASSKDIPYPLLTQTSGVYLEPILEAQELGFSDKVPSTLQHSFKHMF